MKPLVHHAQQHHAKRLRPVAKEIAHQTRGVLHENCMQSGAPLQVHGTCVHHTLVVHCTNCTSTPFCCGNAQPKRNFGRGMFGSWNVVLGQAELDGTEEVPDEATLGMQSKTPSNTISLLSGSRCSTVHQNHFIIPAQTQTVWAEIHGLNNCKLCFSRIAHYAMC